MSTKRLPEPTFIVKVYILIQVLSQFIDLKEIVYKLTSRPPVWCKLINFFLKKSKQLWIMYLCTLIFMKIGHIKDKIRNWTIFKIGHKFGSAFIFIF